MQEQKILKEGDKEYLIIALPFEQKYLGEAFVSKSGKSLVYRRTYPDKTNYGGYTFLKLKSGLIRDKVVANSYFRSPNVIMHQFDGIEQPCLKIPVY